MDRAYEEAFAEVDEILKIMPVDLLSKIPVRFRQVISDNKAKDYKVEIKEPLEEEKLKEETVVILGLIYRDFFASPEEREELQAKDAEELKRIEEELKKQYDMENVFNKRNSEKNQPESLSTDLIVYKQQGFLKKLFNLVKGFFKKNKI